MHEQYDVGEQMASGLGRVAVLVVDASREKRPDGGSRERREREPRQVENVVSVLTEI
ncbi:hypothetical protein [Halorussus marinus]|uniref:hypothetical protein n=1 Tax=Halorussus marinus TaxID=2505976 RepID=UPI001431654C|nr:hypothetical protein [Halorussus marinus]